MSIKKLISIKNPILDALDIIGTDRSTKMPVLLTWATDAEREIGSPYGLIKKKKVIDVVGCKAQLPCCAVILQRAIMGDHGCDCDDLFSSCFNSGVFFNSDTFNSGFLIVDNPLNDHQVGSMLNYEIQDNAIILPRNADGEKLTIQYLGYKEDSDGFIMIGENHKRAITEYILWKYGMSSVYSSQPLPTSNTMEHKMEWFRLCKHARAQDAIPTESEREQIAQMLSDPYAGRGLSVGMYPTSYYY